MAFLRYSVLAFRILMWVLLASLVVFSMATGFGLVQERQKALQATHAAAAEAVNHRMSTISNSLWQYDMAGMAALLRGMVDSGSVARIEVLDRDKVIASASLPGMSQPADHIWTRPIMSPDDRTQIGNLRISESYAEIDSRITASLKAQAATDLVKILGLAAILFTLVYRKVARHLHQMAEDVTRLGRFGDEAPIVLARPHGRGMRDELDVLVDAINRFVAERRDEMHRRSVAEESLRERIAEIEATLGALSDGVIGLDAQLNVRYVNAAACALLRLPSDAINGHAIRDVLQVIHTGTGDDLGALFSMVIGSGEAVHLQRDTLVRAGTTREFDARISVAPVPGSADVAMILVFTDISEEVSAHREIEFQAFHDPLTQLGNRSMLARDLPRDIESAVRQARQVAVLCLDLDNFKNINDTLGHMLGDSMLKQLAQRCKAVVNGKGWVTRHGGDEFVIVLPHIASMQPAIELADRLMVSIAEPFYIEGHELRVTSSIGISICPDHGTGVGKLLSNADLAMYAAKRQGKNACRVFEDRLLQRSTARLTMENGLRVALHEGQLSLVFQPKVNLATRHVDAVEALLRWNDPKAGPIPPDTFIPVAEDTGLIIEIGDWVLRQSLMAARQIKAELGYSVAIAVNVSPVQFRSDALMATLRQLCETTPDISELLEIELTETALSGDLDEVIGKLRAFRDMGLKVAIDDFGTGYSSLAYLKNFPIDILKIDQAFVRGLSESAQDKAIVTTVIQLGRSLGFKTVAEGVELESHAAILQDLGCDYAQGYWFARPQPLANLVSTIHAIGASSSQ